VEACALNVIIYAVFIGLGFRFIITFTFATDCLAGPAYNGPNRKNHIRYAQKPYTPIYLYALKPYGYAHVAILYRYLNSYIVGTWLVVMTCVRTFFYNLAKHKHGDVHSLLLPALTTTAYRASP
jgi:hypothetical protein